MQVLQADEKIICYCNKPKPNKKYSIGFYLSGFMRNK